MQEEYTSAGFADPASDRVLSLELFVLGYALASSYLAALVKYDLACRRNMVLFVLDSSHTIVGDFLLINTQ